MRSDEWPENRPGRDSDSVLAGVTLVCTFVYSNHIQGIFGLSSCVVHVSGLLYAKLVAAWGLPVGAACMFAAGMVPVVWVWMGLQHTSLYWLQSWQTCTTLL